MEALREAVIGGTVVCGGSCGLISWFDGGHSDSADPASFKAAMLGGAATAESEVNADVVVEGGSEWPYVRVPCLGFLPGLVCPHFNQVPQPSIMARQAIHNHRSAILQEGWWQGGLQGTVSKPIT